jgi:inner membrane protein
MEPLTHFMFGGVLARAGLNRTSALATTTLVLASEAADLDVLSQIKGPIYGLQHHRGFTHTFAGTPLVAGFVVLVLYGFYRAFGRRRGKPGKPPPRWGVLFLLACLAGLGHILLDFTNNYGVRPFEPFSFRWYSWDIVFIVEPVLWVILGAGLVLPSLFGLVTEEVHSSRVRAPRGRAAALAALALVLAFWGFRDFQHRRAVAAVDALAYGGEEPLRASAYPYIFNPFRWYAVVETAGAYHSMIVDSRVPEVDPDGRAVARYKPQPTPITQAAKQSYLGRVYLDWAQYPLMETEALPDPDGGYRVSFSDMRFLYPDFPARRGPNAWVLLDHDLKPVQQHFGWSGRRRQE